jgi:CheY-like chemotaxis protein
VLLTQEQQYERRSPVVRMLLEIQPPETGGWPFGDSVLVIDDEQMVRTVHVRQLEQIGCACYAAETEELAVRLLAVDPAIGTVIVDHDMPDITPAELIPKLRALRPGLRIVGNSGSPRQAEFAALGVPRFLLKPWRIQDLIEVLREDGA